MMSVAMLQNPSTTPFNHFEKCGRPDLADQLKKITDIEQEFGTDCEDVEEPALQNNTWNAIFQPRNENKSSLDDLFPYIHPTMKRSPSMLSQKSLEVCTENLGSETGSDDFLSFCDGLMDNYVSIDAKAEQQDVFVEKMDNELQGLTDHFYKHQNKGNELKFVNYHSSSISRRSPVRSFPPPLPSISRRDGPCLQMRPHRRDGRLVVEAVTVPSQNYLHAQREGGRLLLSFVDATYNGESSKYNDTNEYNDEVVEEDEGKEFDAQEEMEMNSFEHDEEEEEEGEEGETVEEKLSSETHQKQGAMKVNCSPFLIDKFFDGILSNCEQDKEHEGIEMKLRNNVTVVEADTVRVLDSDENNDGDNCSSVAMLKLNNGSVKVENKVLIKSKRQNRKESLPSMRRCTQLRRPLFIWKPYTIATLS